MESSTQAPPSSFPSWVSVVRSNCASTLVSDDTLQLIEDDAPERLHFCGECGGNGTDRISRKSGLNPVVETDACRDIRHSVWDDEWQSERLGSTGQDRAGESAGARKSVQVSLVGC